jgi:2',3'-cyclic-nucleotide 2'-phosphodiesterase (5'-nucleotidase family)
VKELRERERGILLLDAGDLLFRRFLKPIPEPEQEMLAQKAHLIVESFNLMGYDALGIGDDDLSLGKAFLLEISKKARFPFLSSNVVDEASGKPLFETYVVKRVNGLRIGLLSLLSPDLFSVHGDERKKGLVFRNPSEVARALVSELQPKTDLIILLSHLGYPKDVEIANSVPGIHLIVGSHTGMNLPFPPVINNAVILQMAPKGLYTGRFDLTFHNNRTSFYNIMTKRALEGNLNSLRHRLSSVEAPEAEKAQWRRTEKEMERNLQKLEGKNEFTNALLPLAETVKDDPEILRMVETYKAKYPETAKPHTPVERPHSRAVPGQGK